MRSALALVVGLLTALSVGGAHGQAGGWVAVAADSAGSAITTATGPSKAEAGRRAKTACGRATCDVVADRQGGCAGALRLVLMGPVQKWTGQRESEWRTHFQRTCPSGQCAKAMACVTP
ncbi:MAG: hypothetical protein FJX20_12615 [Alphaproteobacteria bacterium]|nr:hypothetical protein [Alphaproteobacteria bacterium]